MQEIKENCYKGTRILLGNEKRYMIDSMIQTLRSRGFVEISIPIIQLQEVFHGKTVGKENHLMMYKLTDMAERPLCLAPEYTSVIMNLKDTFKHQKDVKVFYVQECFRGEKPQTGRYRQFTQLGVEIINPTKPYNGELIRLAWDLILHKFGYSDTINNSEIEIKTKVVRGLDYYIEGTGFEILCDKLGAQKQVCGGGEYEGGIGFAIGIDRLLLLKQSNDASNTGNGR